MAAGGLVAGGERCFRLECDVSEISRKPAAKVLVTGAGALLGQGIIRSIRAASRPYSIVGVDPSPLSAGLYWCDSAYRGPMAKDPGFVDAFLRIIEIEKPDVLIPGTDLELAVFAANRPMIEAATGCKVLVASPEAVEIADDKAKTSAFLAENGFPFPPTARATDREAVASLVRDLGFPLIAKPRIGARSVGVRLLENEADLELVSRDPDYIVQEHIGTPDQEFTASGLFVDGDCRAEIVMRRDLRDGNTYRAYVEDDARLQGWVRKWTAALAAFGPANFQFRLRPDGTPVVFEINARFSGTTPLRAQAGFNEVEMMLDHLLTGEAIRRPPIESCILLRHWSETVVSTAMIAEVSQA